MSSWFSSAVPRSVGAPWIALSLGLSFALPGVVSCAGPRPAPWPQATSQTWPGLRRALDVQRASRPRGAWSAGLQITMRDPRSGRVIDGRGAIAVAPGEAVRMILIGAAGATMLDAWVTRTRWRIAVPPLEIIRRGGMDEPRDMPVGFLRWWFLTPLTGMLFAAAPSDGGFLWLLRDPRAVIELNEATCARGRLLHATRRVVARGGDVEHAAPVGRAETVDECREQAAPTVGDSARYVDGASGLRVDMQFESIAAEPPRGEAFQDPDLSGSGT